MRTILLALVVICWGTTSAFGADLIPADHPLASPPSFANDIVPILTRFGCNAGACHGKLAGQKGFKLSLRGFAPEQDFEAIAREGRSRRIDPAGPELSLLLQKATNAVPHGGGERIARGSPAYELLKTWIAAGGPNGAKVEPVATKLIITPAHQNLKVGEAAQLKAVATYSDGRTRDVTWLTRFESNDPSQLECTLGGQMKPLRHGESAIRASFMEQVEIAVFTTPYEAEVPAERFAKRNNVIDEHLFNKLAALRLEPSGDCDDATFIRRAFLDCVGTLPTPEEVRAFTADARGDKRAQLVEQILNRPEFIDFWTLQLADLLQNRKERDHDVRGAKGVRAFHDWLRGEVAANRPWNELARSVLLAEGSAVEKPQIGYYVVTVGEKSPHESEVADSVAQAFLGTRIGCARCHNHPLEGFTQDDYYHFVGFFSKVTLERSEPEKGATKLTVGTRDLLNLRREREKHEKKLAEQREKNADAKQIEEIEKQIANFNKQIADQQMRPAGVNQPRTGKFLGPQPLDRSVPALAPGDDPRAKLVEWMTRPDNRQFTGSMINRLWRHFFAVGLVEPVDDLRATNPASNRELWDALHKEFVGSGYQLKHLMRLLLNSRAYQLASETTAANATDARFYSHYYVRRLPAEVLLDGICQVTGLPEKFPGYPLGVRAIQIPDPNVDSYFLNTFGRSPRVTACACERSGEVTLPQLLHLQCGQEIGRKIASGESRLVELLKAENDNAKLIDELFLATLARVPNAAERQALERALADGANRGEVFTDLLWVLLNTKEFAFNH